jgi:hypothetical protein
MNEKYERNPDIKNKKEKITMNNTYKYRIPLIILESGEKVLINPCD